MTTTMTFAIGDQVGCSDGPCGELTRVIIDPVAREVTHLVIEPKHHRSQARLVPLDLLDPSLPSISLRCTLAHFATLDPAQESEFLPGNGGYSDYEAGHAMSWPYYGIGLGGGMGMGMGGLGAGMGLGGELGYGPPPPPTYESIPIGEIDIHRGDRVHASDDEIGRVQGLVVTMPEHRVSHVLLQEGHLFTRKDVAIPISAIAGLDHGIQLNITKQQVEDLEPVTIDHMSLSR
jgi:hypothetical protein